MLNLDRCVNYRLPSYEPYISLLYRVVKLSINYKEIVSVNEKEKPDTDIKDIIVRSLKQPTCISAKEKENSINIEIEKELGVEVVGDTKVKIAIEEDEDAWDILEDDYDDEIDKEIDNSVKEDFIKEEK